MKFLGWLLRLFFGEGKGSTVIEELKITKFIMKWEGFRARPYICSGGKLTIGYGRTDFVQLHEVTTKEKELVYLRTKIASIRKEVLAVLADQNYYEQRTKGW